MSDVAAQTESFVMVSGNTMVVTETVDEVERKLSENDGSGSGEPWMDLTLTDGKRFRVLRSSVNAYWAGRYE